MFEISFWKPCQSKGERDQGESIQINFRDEVFLSITLSNSHFE